MIRNLGMGFGEKGNGQWWFIQKTISIIDENMTYDSSQFDLNIAFAIFLVHFGCDCYRLIRVFRSLVDQLRCTDFPVCIVRQ